MYGIHDMYICIYVCVYILASVCQQLLQLARGKTESSRNNFGELAKMAGIFNFLLSLVFICLMKNYVLD